MKEPSRAILNVCDAIDNTVEKFLEIRATLSVGTYEADVEALLIFNLAIRNVQALTALARHDLELLPAAFVLARAAMETGVRAAWLVNDTNPMLREARWLAHVDGEISALKRSADRLQSVGSDKQPELTRAMQLQNFRDKVANALQKQGVELLKQTPKFEAMLSSIGGHHLYATYIEASQYAHGGHQATWLYRSGGVGSEKELVETVGPSQWILPLRMCWLALAHPGEIVVTRISSNGQAQWSKDCTPLIEAAFEDLVTGNSGSFH